jgi:hypothetical protein
LINFNNLHEGEKDRYLKIQIVLNNENNIGTFKKGNTFVILPTVRRTLKATTFL